MNTKTPKLQGVESWPARKVEMRLVDKIIPYPNNPRTHPPEQIEMLAGMMKRYGVDQPIVVDENGVILKGHGRRLAALSAGFERFPVVVHHGLSEAEKRAMRIEDNQAALLAGWDEGLMKLEVGGLQDGGYDLTLLGFEDAELNGFLDETPTPAADPDEIPEPVKNPTVRQGDLWMLGDHRLFCGDGTLKESWDKLMKPSERADMVFTDPPYGVSYEATSGKYGVIEGDHKRRDALYKMLLTSFRQMTAHAADTAAFYIWHASSTRVDFSQAMNAAGLAERQYLIWVKPGIILGHSDYRWQHEPCFYASKSGSKPKFYGDRSDSTVWHVQLGGKQKDVAATVGNGILILDGAGGQLFVQSRVPKNKKLRQLRITEGQSAFLSGSDRQDGTVWEVARDSNHVHPTQKPVELARRAIENSSKPSGIVLDGFLGSGTTIIGAEMTGRRGYGLELDPVYAQVAIERWQRMTGKKALHAETGKTLDQTGRTKNATRNPRKSVQGSHGSRHDPKPPVRARSDARQSAPRREPAGVTPAVAGDSE